jgi:hypothetical protein
VVVDVAFFVEVRVVRSDAGMLRHLQAWGISELGYASNAAGVGEISGAAVIWGD